jgi:hypothetical protein
MFGHLKRPRPSTSLVVIAVGAVVLVGAGSAEAATLISGKDIKPHSITGTNIQHHSLFRIDLSPHTISSLQGDTGARGVKGDTGARGPIGDQATFSSLPWGVIGRNTIGSPVAQYRVGPGTTPAGDGSLGIEVAGPPNGDTSANPALDAQKLAFGVSGADFGTETGITNPKAITSLSYEALTDMDFSSTTAINPPGLTIESNPDISDGTGPITFTSLVYAPPVVTSSQVGSWQTYDATAPAVAPSGWFATGRAGTATGCTQATPCSLSDLQSHLGTNATIITFAFGKGRDNAFIGDLDNLKVNSSTFDFDPLGVTKR